ncbi:MAG TPA: MBOAT family O-acyltransferase [Alphaproteobacteria bacterium]
MSFNSLTFAIFIAVFAAIWPFVKESRLLRYLAITLASFLFYGWWDWRFLFLIIMTGLVDFFAGIAMERAQTKNKRRLILGASLLSNLGVLSIFKYGSFFAHNVDAILGTGLEAAIPPFMLILPVGISFYTFQSLSYTIDVYKGKLQPTHSLIHFFAFLSLFPQLVAGPIIRATDLLWRLEAVPHTTEPQRFAAIRLIVAGYIQKLLIADHLAGYVDASFANPQSSFGTIFWWGVMAAFAVQIYCDFAGYSNIARGLLKYMGWNIKPNFKFPYFAIGFRDFWNRWHISLSHWFRDYVYIPLGGAKSIVYLWITMLASGLWHGANWTFLAWGGLHAAYVSLERYTNWPARIPALPAIIITAAMTILAWVFFRAGTFADAWHIASNMLTPVGNNTPVTANFPILAMFFFISFELYGYFRPWRHAIKRYEPILLGILFFIALAFRGEGHGFIYFQF